MKAAVYREHHNDPIQVAKIEDIETPKPKSNEVLIIVEAAAYNYNDLWGIWGKPIKILMPHISGSDSNLQKPEWHVKNFAAASRIHFNLGRSRWLLHEIVARYMLAGVGRPPLKISWSGSLNTSGSGCRSPYLNTVWQINYVSIAL